MSHKILSVEDDQDALANLRDILEFGTWFMPACAKRLSWHNSDG